MFLPDAVITKEEFIESKVLDEIAASKEKACDEYHSLLSKKLIEEKDGDKASESFALVRHTTSLMLNAGSSTEPFGPCFEMSTHRAMIPSDLKENNLISLENLVEVAEDPEILSRALDILWICKRGYKFGLRAVEEYIKAADELEDPENWINSAERLERAWRLARHLNNIQLVARVRTIIESKVEKYRSNDSFYAANLIYQLLEIGGDTSPLIPIAREHIDRISLTKDSHKLREYLEIEYQLKSKAGDQDAYDSKKEIAESYAKDAESSVAAGSYLGASQMLTKAIEAYRRIPGSTAKANELHQLKISYQKNIDSELKTFTSDLVDISDTVKAAIGLVENKSFIDAIHSLSKQKSIVKSQLKTASEKIMQQFIFRYIADGVTLNDEGKTVGVSPTIETADDQTNALQVTMYEQATSYYIPTLVTSVIEPARRHMVSEGKANLKDFIQLVTDNPFVPPGKEYIFALALYAGFKGDWLQFGSLITSQLEASIRYILEQYGVVVTNIDDKGIQTEKDLNTLLYFPELEEILGEDIVFSLRALLIVQAGPNLRNRFAHGLIDTYGFRSIHFVYLWWLVIKMIALWDMAIIAQAKIREENGST